MTSAGVNFFIFLNGLDCFENGEFGVNREEKVMLEDLIISSYSCPVNVVEIRVFAEVFTFYPMISLRTLFCGRKVFWSDEI